MRSAVSIRLNIAEGAGKSSEKELVRFIDIAFGSLYETRAAVDLLEEAGYVSPTEVNELDETLASIGRQLGGLKRAARRRIAPGK